MTPILSIQLFGQFLFAGIYDSSEGGRLSDAQRASVRKVNKRARQIAAEFNEDQSRSVAGDVPEGGQEERDSESVSTRSEAVPTTGAVAPSPNDTALSAE